MKLSIVELRDMVADVVAEALTEGRGRKPKEVPMRTPESVAAERDRKVRGMPGYFHSEANDFSRPLGPANLVKRQGQSGMGGWTSEGAKARLQQKIHELQIRRLVRTIVAEEIRALRK